MLVWVHDVSAMPALGTQSTVGWIQHTVRPLLCAAGAFGATVEARAGRALGRDCPASRKPYQGGCFAGAEGDGCRLSREEQSILIRVKNEAMSWEA
jgi:hypothetical protein